MPNFVDLGPRQRRRVLAAVMVRALGTVTVLVLLYYVLPFDRLSDTAALLLMILGLAGMMLALAWEVRAILHANYPGMRAVEALATLVPLFLLLFATLYYLMDRAVPSSFSQHLSRTDSLYFTVTTFATVGYGDITATSSGARIAVTLQMILDLIVIGVGIKALLGAVQMGQKLRATEESQGEGPGIRSKPTA